MHIAVTYFCENVIDVPIEVKDVVTVYLVTV